MSFGFGAQASSQPLFGAPASSNSLFGAPASSQSLFGAPASSQSLFGAPASSQSLFGAPASSQSLFGAPASSQSLFGAPTSQSLFGAPAASQSLFGAPASSQSLFGAPAPSQSLFGAPASSQSLFGAPSSSQSLFGAPASSQSLFAAHTPSQSLFPQSAPSLFGQPNAPQQPPQQPPQLPRALHDVIERLNPLHPSSPFHAALYNVVPAADLSRYTRPTDFDEKLWELATTQNPDPSRMVPVQANNFDDLLTRADLQSQRLSQHLSILSKIATDLTNMEDDANTNITTKLAAYRRSHRELARKLLRISAAVDTAVAREMGGGGLTQTEVDRRRRVEAVARALAAPAEFRDKLADLVEVAESSILERKIGPQVEIRDGRAAAAIRELLKDQLKGIEHLEEVCERTERDVGIMTDVLEGR